MAETRIPVKRCLQCDHLFGGESWMCPACSYSPENFSGFLQFAAAPTGAEGGFKAEYFAQLAGFEGKHFWFRARNRLIQWALKEFQPQASSFFEIGCGTGFVLKGLRQELPEIELAGSELFSEGLHYAQQRLPGVNLYQMDARKIPFSQEFDAIGAFDVLEHIPEDEVVLHEMFETVKPGGGLFLTVPQHPFLWTEVDEHSMHQRRYTRRELRSKVERAGFRVQRITSFVSLLLPLMIAARFGQKKSRVSEHSWDEFEIHPLLNLVLENVLDVERWMIRVGASLPAGGSLLLVAKKPA